MTATTPTPATPAAGTMDTNGLVGLAERHTGEAWLAGAALWAASAAFGVAGAGDSDGTGYVLYESLWIVAHLALLVGIVGLYRSAAGPGSRAGRAGTAIAVVGRLLFVAGEIDCLRTGTDESALLPLGALTTVVGMLTLGVAVLHAGRWTGWRRRAPLAVGLYPLAAMFPIVAATGEPSVAAIGAWAVTFAAVGIAARQEAGLPARQEAGLPTR
jgi:hypothetical protein